MACWLTNFNDTVISTIYTDFNDTDTSTIYPEKYRRGEVNTVYE